MKPEIKIKISRVGV